MAGKAHEGTTIGRFGVRIAEIDGWLAGVMRRDPREVELSDADGNVLGSISLGAARVTPAVDLCESAERRLGLGPFCRGRDVDDFVLTKDEVAGLNAWARGIA